MSFSQVNTKQEISRVSYLGVVNNKFARVISRL